MAVTQLEGLTYHHGTSYLQTSTETTITVSHRGNQTSETISTTAVVQAHWVIGECLRIDGYWTPEETLSYVDVS